jgi:uncharacterized repeat protein (TIGR03803 family)
MVGTNPSSGSTSTKIPVVIIPIKFVFADGTVLSAGSSYPQCGLSKSASSLAQQSPLFHSYNFYAGGTKVGDTQYIDAFQRANFWNYVSTTSSGYHVQLTPLTIKATQTVNVSSTEGSTGSGPCLLSKIGFVNLSFFDLTARSLITKLGIPSTSLPVFLSYDTEWAPSGTSCTTCYVGYHSVTSSNQTYVFAAYLDPNFAGTRDVAALSHELGEWMNDPLVSNVTPGWEGGQATQCQFNLEVGDPLTGTLFTATLNGTTYHLQDLTFWPWFARESPSTSVNGWYTFLNSYGSAPAVCYPFAVLHSFDYSDGANPNAGMVLANNGNLYGTTTSGTGPGNIFSIALPSDAFSILYTFVGGNNGGTPNGTLIQASDGNLYGTTTFGGLAGSGGTIFRFSLAGSLTTIFSFNGNPDGAEPFAGVVQGSDGNLYGTTFLAGSGGEGTVFRVATDGSGFAVLFAFDGTHGAQPYAPVIQGSDRYFYGTTIAGGIYGQGVIFKIGSAGGTPIILHSFDSLTDGGSPYAGLVQANDGNLYGTTSSGGPGGYGTIFKIDPAGVSFSVLHSFDYSVEGAYPSSALVQGYGGNLFGASYSGGSGGNGTMFGINLEGTLTLLEPFGSSADGSEATGTLTADPNGVLYGTTFIGGLFGDGVVFQVGP